MNTKVCLFLLHLNRKIRVDKTEDTLCIKLNDQQTINESKTALFTKSVDIKHTKQVNQWQQKEYQWPYPPETYPHRPESYRPLYESK